MSEHEMFEVISNRRVHKTDWYIIFDMNITFSIGIVGRATEWAYLLYTSDTMQIELGVTSAVSIEFPSENN